MTNSKNTKRALLASVLSLILCAAMLIGSTFAWFTDSVTSGRNKIVAGNLDVELYAKVGAEYTPVAADTNLFLENTLWEPGHVEVVNLKVANLGTLALQYKLGINVTSETEGKNVEGNKFKLSDFIRFSLIDGEQTYLKREDAVAAAEAANPVKLSALAMNKDGVLHPEGKGDSERPVTMIVYMPADLGNVANYMTGTKAPTINFGVKLLATQTPFEKDSFDINYDANATVENEFVKLTFTNASDAAVLCAECFNHPGSDHAGHGTYVEITDGVAKIPRTGAWLEFADLNWQESSYVLEYDVDLTELPSGAFVAFDTGEQTSWQDLQLGFKNDDGTFTAYNALSGSGANMLGTVNSKVHAAYTFAADGEKLMMELVVSDGVHSYTVKKNATIEAQTKLYWDVYTAEGGTNRYGALDNIVFRGLKRATAASAEELKDAIRPGETVVLTDNIDLAASGYDSDHPFTVDADNVTLDLNGNSISALNVGFNVTGDNVTIKNGTIKRPEGRTYSYGLRLCGANAVVENVAINSGINVSGYNPDDSVKEGVSVTIRNCHITLDCEWAYYAVCAQGEAKVEVSDVTIERTDSGKANYYFWVEKEFTDDLGYVGNSSITLKNVTMNSTCGTAFYNPGGVEPIVIEE